MFEIIENDSDKIFLLKGDINTFNIESLDLLIEEDEHNIILDFKDVSSIDSKAISLLTHTKRKLLHTNRNLKVINISESAYKILVVAGIDFLME